MNSHKFRILDRNNRIQHTGGNSWMTLAKAKRIVNRQAGEKIYEYCQNTGRRMWEIL